MDQILRVFWELDDNLLTAQAQSDHSAVCYRLVAEKLPDVEIWDWSVWLGEDLSAMVKHGVAESVLDAMREAQAIAREWDQAGQPRT